MATAVGHAELAARLHAEIDRLERRQDAIPFLDDPDMRFRNRVWRPEPIATAVMFCLMDVSASMDETKKDLAKRFFALLYMFLTRKYEQVDLVFIRHTDDAEEVDEDTFFHDPRSGGTVVFSALELADKIRKRALCDRAGTSTPRRRPTATRSAPTRHAAHASCASICCRRCAITRTSSSCPTPSETPPVHAVGGIRAPGRGERARSRCAAHRDASRSIPCSASCSERRRTS